MQTARMIDEKKREWMRHGETGDMRELWLMDNPTSLAILYLCWTFFFLHIFCFTKKVGLYYDIMMYCAVDYEDSPFSWRKTTMTFAKSQAKAAAMTRHGRRGGRCGILVLVWAGM